MCDVWNISRHTLHVLMLGDRSSYKHKHLE